MRSDSSHTQQTLADNSARELTLHSEEDVPSEKPRDTTACKRDQIYHNILFPQFAVAKEDSTKKLSMVSQALKKNLAVMMHSKISLD